MTTPAWVILIYFLRTWDGANLDLCRNKRTSAAKVFSYSNLDIKRTLILDLRSIHGGSKLRSRTEILEFNPLGPISWLHAPKTEILDDLLGNFNLFSQDFGRRHVSWPKYFGVCTRLGRLAATIIHGDC